MEEPIVRTRGLLRRIPPVVHEVRVAAAEAQARTNEPFASQLEGHV